MNNSIIAHYVFTGVYWFCSAMDNPGFEIDIESKNLGKDSDVSRDVRGSQSETTFNKSEDEKHDTESDISPCNFELESDNYKVNNDINQGNHRVKGRVLSDKRGIKTNVPKVNSVFESDHSPGSCEIKSDIPQVADNENKVVDQDRESVIELNDKQYVTDVANRFTSNGDTVKGENNVEHVTDRTEKYNDTSETGPCVHNFDATKDVRDRIVLDPSKLMRGTCNHL